MSISVFKRFLAGLGYAVLTASSGFSSPALADDTEVFFPDQEVTNTGTVRPNILFAIDTSGSMGANDGFSQTRLQRVQQAFIQIMDELNPNVNVGLMRYSNRQGGPVMFPVARVDELVENVDLSGNLQVDSYRSNGTGGEAFERNNAAVTVAPQTLVIGGQQVSVYSLSTTGADEVEQFSNGFNDGGTSRCGSDLELGSDNANNNTCSALGWSNVTPGYQVVGLRFPGVDVPKDAVIESAHIVFTVSTTTGNRNNGGYIILGEAADNSAPFTGGTSVSNRPNGGRSFTSAVLWPNVPQPAAEEKLISPNLKLVVDEIRGRAGWAVGNPMTFIMGAEQNDFLRTVYGGKNNSVNRVPKLVITYAGGSSNGTENIGLRFEKVQIPRGATVVSANLTVRSDAVHTNEALSVSIRPEKVGDAAAYTTAASNISSRTYLSGVNWDIPSFGAHGDDYTSPDLADILTSLFASSSWCGGNSLTLRLNVTSGKGARSIIGSAQDPSLAPVLTIGLKPNDSALATGCNRTTTAAQVAAKSDDSTELTSDNSNNTNAGTGTGTGRLTLGTNNTTTSAKKVIIGTRFTGLNVPKGAKIVAAALDFVARDADTSAAGITIKGEAVGNPGTYSSTAAHISGRMANVTSAQASWTFSNWVAETTYTSPDITAIVQEIVNRGDWNPGNAMAFFMTSNSATGIRRAYSNDASTGKAPRLRITFEGEVGKPTVRQFLKQVVNSFSPNGFTPTTGVLYEAGRYFRGEPAFYGLTRGGGDSTEVGQDDLGPAPAMAINHRAVYDYSKGAPKREFPPGCSEFNLNSSKCALEQWSGKPVYKSPIVDGCQTNNVVILSDGIPNNTNLTSFGASNKSARALVEEMIAPKKCVAKKDSKGNNQGEWICADELANHLFTTDNSTKLAGTQGLRTYTIAFGPDLASGSSDAVGAEYLRNMALSGGGEFFTANSAAEVAEVFRAIIAQILDKGATFVAPAVTVNTFNRLTHRNELYFALFKPSQAIRWEGNLKRYQLFQRSSDPNPRVFDANQNVAVDDQTGFFVDSAQSFWSLSADGNDVKRGGAASKLTSTRRLYTNIASNPKDLQLVGATNEVKEDNANITKAMLGNASMTDAERTDILKWARGVDVLDENGNGKTDDVRQRIGDPLHSEPALVIYGGDDKDPDLTIFFGTNDGQLHAINSKTGEELWAYAPRELLPNLERYYENTGSYTARPYGVDGAITFKLKDNDGDGGVLDADGKPDESKDASNNTVKDSVTLYAALRRGGRSYYALDVINREKPVVKFQIQGGTGDFEELGQTWSRAIPAKIKKGGAVKEVIIFSGGYDPVQDSKTMLYDTNGDPIKDSMGRGVFMADANTGELVWWAGYDDPAVAKNPNLSIDKMRFSVAASPAPIDLDGDGIIDRLYLTDLGGQLTRIVFPESDVSQATGDVIARLANNSSTGARRIFGSPDVAFIRGDNGETFLSVSFGTGHREKPLSSKTEDRFYILRDPDVTNDSTTSFFVTGDNDLVDATDPTTNNLEANIAAKKGLYIRLVSSGFSLTGEKALTDSTTFNNTVIFATFEPSSSSAASAASCKASQGQSRLYQVRVSSGKPANSTDKENPTRDDRVQLLAQAGLPPAPILIFPSISAHVGTDGNRTVCNGPECISTTPLICAGAECVPANTTRTVRKTFWREQPDGVGKP